MRLGGRTERGMAAKGSLMCSIRVILGLSNSRDDGTGVAAQATKGTDL